MKKSKEDTLATDEHGITRNYTEMKKSKEDTLATDEHGKRKIKHSHRQDAKSAKEDKKSELA